MCCWRAAQTLSQVRWPPPSPAPANGDCRPLPRGGRLPPGVPSCFVWGWVFCQELSKQTTFQSQAWVAAVLGGPLPPGSEDSWPRSPLFPVRLSFLNDGRGVFSTPCLLALKAWRGCSEPQAFRHPWGGCLGPQALGPAVWVPWEPCGPAECPPQSA